MAKPITIDGAWWARIVHLLCSYWGLVLLGAHIGLHLGSVGQSPFSAPFSKLRGTASGLHGYRDPDLIIASPDDGYAYDTY